MFDLYGLAEAPFGSQVATWLVQEEATDRGMQAQGLEERAGVFSHGHAKLTRELLEQLRDVALVEPVREIGEGHEYTTV